MADEDGNTRRPTTKKVKKKSTKPKKTSEEKARRTTSASADSGSQMQQVQLSPKSRNNNRFNSEPTANKSPGRSSRFDDDDFSVAPSMDQNVKSVLSVGFDEVYARGRKVSQCNLQPVQWVALLVSLHLYFCFQLRSFLDHNLSFIFAYLLWLDTHLLWLDTFFVSLIARFGCLCRRVYWNAPPDWSRICSQTNRSLDHVLGRPRCVEG